ncbi:aldo/keto reductase [Ectothiorhodospiraceae bacterium BW-2]|nr:aldo/keto reductase [Ectothiorhodospiraceae bacterium BW-2]
MSLEVTQLGESALYVSKIGLGTMTFGEQNSEAEAHQQLDYALEAGINLIDTAEMYPVPARAETVHRTESIVGHWLARQPRERIILSTKATGGGRGMGWIRGGDHAFTRANLRRALEGSLTRLQSDYIDLYQLHWPERNTPMFGQFRFHPALEHDSTPIEETLAALSELVDEGKVRAIGLSNEWPWGVMRFLQAAKEHNLPRIVSVQNCYNLLNRTYETALLELNYREKIALLAYSPLAFGHLSGKYLHHPLADGRVTRFGAFSQRYAKPMVPVALKAYSEAAAQFGLSLTQFALAYVYSRWFCATTLIGATTMAQLQENIAAIEIHWSEAMEQAVDEIQLSYFNPAP